MFHDLQLSADRRQLAETCGMTGAALLSAARQHRAETMKPLLAAQLVRRNSPRVRPMATAVVLAVTALLLAYGAPLSLPSLEP